MMHLHSTQVSFSEYIVFFDWTENRRIKQKRLQWRTIKCFPFFNHEVLLQGFVLKFCKIAVPRQFLKYILIHILKIHNVVTASFVSLHKGATDVDLYVVVYNPLAWNITTFVTVSVSSEAMSVYDELGYSVPAQVLQLWFFLLLFSSLVSFL